MQLDFPQQLLFKVAPDDPRIDRLVGLLRAQGWLKRAQIAEYLQWDERAIRSVAEAAPELIASWQKGFYLTELCAVDDLTRAANQLDGQIKSNTRKVLAWRQIAHRRVG